MSDELRAWLGHVKARLKDAHLGGLGARDAVGEDALQADNTAKLVYGDLPALIAKVEELAGALYQAERYMTEKGVSHEYPVMIDARNALRAPGGGARG